MKKIILIFILILAVVYGVLAVLGSRGEYTAEKILYRAIKTSSKMASNPDVVLPALSATVENDLKEILKKYPDSNTAKIAGLTLTEFYVNNKKYTQALELSDAILKKYSGNPDIASRAQFLKGVVYERQNRWDEALEEYDILRDKYPHTELGIQIPLFIGRYYESKNMASDAQRAYENGVVFYKNIESQNKGNMLGYAASNLLAQTYVKLKRYEDAGKTIEDTINNYPSEITYYQSLPIAEFIYLKLLNKPAKIIEIYKTVQERTRNNQLKKFLAIKIKDLEKKEQ